MIKKLNYILVIAMVFCIFTLAKAQTLDFAGFKWKTKNGYDFPGKNYWRDDNVSVDEKGFLHLKIRKIDDVWTTAEVFSVEEFSYGTVSFEVIGSLQNLDKNVVLGLFQYPTSKSKADGAGEIDIEFAKWGNEKGKIGNFTAVSDKNNNFSLTDKFDFSSDQNLTLHTFERTSKSVFFQSFQAADSLTPFHKWKFENENISKIPLPIHINFWLFRAQPPSNLQDAEIIIKSVKFIKSDKKH
jgi:hypothetical protein